MDSSVSTELKVPLLLDLESSIGANATGMCAMIPYFFNRRHVVSRK